MKAPWLCWYRTRGLAWFRVFGYGAHAKDVRLHPLTFSQRQRKGPWWRRVFVGHWMFGILSRDP